MHCGYHRLSHYPTLSFLPPSNHLSYLTKHTRHFTFLLARCYFFRHITDPIPCVILAHSVQNPHIIQQKQPSRHRHTRPGNNGRDLSRQTPRTILLRIHIDKRRYQTGKTVQRSRPEKTSVFRSDGMGLGGHEMRRAREGVRINGRGCHTRKYGSPARRSFCASATITRSYLQHLYHKPAPQSLTAERA